MRLRLMFGCEEDDTAVRFHPPNSLFCPAIEVESGVPNGSQRHPT